MGRDKAKICHHGVPHVRYLAGMLVEIAPTYVSMRPEQAGDPAFRGLKLLPDTVEGVGPIAGLLAAFSLDPRAAWLLAAVDMPNLTLPALAWLAAHRDPGAPATAYRVPGMDMPEPLCAIYEPGILPQLEREVGIGHYGLRFLLEEGARLVEPIDAGATAGVNTPREMMVAAAGLECG